MRAFAIIFTLYAIAAGAAGAKVLVWDHDGGQTFDDPEGGGTVGTDYAVMRALAANGVNDAEKKYVLPSDLSGYDVVFVLCGFWPRDGELSFAERQALETYLTGDGGNLYLEGTELARRYSNTPLFTLAGTGFADDGRPQEEGNVNVAEGIGPWAGAKWDYYAYQADAPDAYVDELTAAEGEVVIRSRRAGNQSNGRLVRYAPGGYRTIVSSFIFGAVADGAYKKAGLMSKYLAFFGVTSDFLHSDVAPASLGRIRALFR